ncbi:YbaB/EbfC family nucleoid-associated protein [Nocardia sp. IBHARD005]|uniref:YbaB/EbfC family nucleoid-associated protein n=1 Tax=Nocardia sp. IBHARD005 TaxID=3457765 RepID=UPI004059DF8D
MSNNLDPLPKKTTALVQALTSTRSTVTAADGLVQVQAGADGSISVHIDDKVLVLGGAGLSKLITELAAHALRTARTNAQDALTEFRSDPRVAGAVARTVDAMNGPLPSRPMPHNVTDRSVDELDHRNTWGR